jgi:acetylornithine deacetylase
MDTTFEGLEPHPLLGRPSVHASLIRGGAELSTYPDHCRIDLERRTLPSESQQTVEEELKLLIDQIAVDDSEFRAESNVFFYRPALEVSEDLDLIRILCEETRRVAGKDPNLVGAGWWTDAALLVDAGIPTVLFGHSGDGAHAPIEYADFDSLVKMTEVLVRTTVSFCS